MQIKSEKNENRICFVLHVLGITQPKNQIPSSKVVIASTRTHRQAHTMPTSPYTRAKVNIEDTLSGFQEFFLQPIIKHR